MSSPLQPEVDPTEIPPADTDDLMAGRPGGPPRRLLALGLLVVIAVGAAFYLSRDGDSSKSDIAATVTDGGDLGALSDAQALSDRLAPELAERSDSPPASVPAGSVPCDDSEAALPQDQAELVYSARLDWEGTPSVVLGYRVEGPSLQRLLLVMAEADCRLIVTQSF